jgi:hypothetical protein
LPQGGNRVTPIEHQARHEGEAGRRLVEERFAMRVTTAQLADIYRELAERVRNK